MEVLQLYNITLETFDLKSGELLRSELWGLYGYHKAVEVLKNDSFTQLDDVNFTRSGLSTYTNAKINFNTK